MRDLLQGHNCHFIESDFLHYERGDEAHRELRATSALVEEQSFLLRKCVSCGLYIFNHHDLSNPFICQVASPVYLSNLITNEFNFLINKFH